MIYRNNLSRRDFVKIAGFALGTGALFGSEAILDGGFYCGKGHNPRGYSQR